MAEKVFYTHKKEHLDPDGFGPIPSWADGVDNFEATVPDGERFTRYEILRKNLLADCQVTKTPRPGARGKVELDVKWNYALFGKVDYRVRLYSSDAKPRPTIVNVGSEAWDQRALDLIHQGVPFKLRIAGSDALTVFNLLSPRSLDTIRKSYELQDDEERSTAVHIRPGQPGQPRVIDPVTIAVVAALTLIALAGFATLAFVVQKAVDAGKCVNAKHTVRGPSPIDDSLEFDIHEC